MAAMAACDADRAREALGRAQYSGDTRETSLVAVELALRTGDDAQRAAARRHLSRLLQDPQGSRDPWVAAIAADAKSRCP
jgi:hypothetical protein